MPEPENPYFYEAIAAMPGWRDPWFERPADVLDVDNYMALRRLRETLVSKYAWAIPSPGAIHLISLYSPLVEIGAGTGYWAWQLEQAGADIVAYDIAPPDRYRNHWHNVDEHDGWQPRPTWTRVRRGGPAMLRFHQDRTLLLCWPPYRRDMAYECLKRYHGEHVVFVGEHDGATGNDAFFRMLENEYEEITTAAIPQWPGLNDHVEVWERTKKPPRSP